MDGVPVRTAEIRDRETLRARLHRAGGDIDPEGWLLGDEGHDRAVGERRPAAVLLGLIDRPDGPSIILTQRTAHLRDHAGQISLPGGRLEPVDAGPADAALREAQEEIGLEPQRVDLLGGLRHYDTITGFRIHPVIGWIEPPMVLRPDPYEVAEVFELPLSFALDRTNHCRESVERNGVRRHFYVLPYQSRYIWGATAGILVNFARLLAD
ncbi:MAG: CoA pyrophosphatase [Geminicoccaceae bacterium]